MFYSEFLFWKGSESVLHINKCPLMIFIDHSYFQCITNSMFNNFYYKDNAFIKNKIHIIIMFN